jgi:2-desacetyl-2-hydroxyethyl bacteriochlorophyllide A dehydrogenase
MKTLVCIKPGLFEYRDQDEPLLTPGHSIIKVKRLGICGTDIHAFGGTQPYFDYPRILGHELSGSIVAQGSFDEFTNGERISIIPYLNCNNCIACRNGLTNCCTNIKVFGVHFDGGMAEYLSVPDYLLVHGEDMSFDTLSLLEPLAIGAHGIRRANIQPGEFVLVVGAGPIGLSAMQFATIAGGEVIAMDINTERLSFSKDKLNIHHTIDALSEDVFEQLAEITNGDMPTVVIDATGNRSAINNSLLYLAHGGRYILIGLQKDKICFSHPEFHKRETTLMSSRNATRKDFDHVIECIRNGSVNPLNYITHRADFNELKNVFESWTKTENGVIKAMVDFN